MRLALADDGRLFREGLAALLAAAGHEVVISVADGDALMSTLGAEDSAPVDVAVLDIRMPPANLGGLVVAAELRRRYPRTGLLLLSNVEDPTVLDALLDIDTRAIGFRLKDRVTSLAALDDTLERIADGELVIDPALARSLRRNGRVGASPLDSLTPRERDVLALMAEGRSNTAIAEKLHLSVKSIERYVALIFGKLDLPADAASYHRRVLAVLAFLRGMPTQ